MKVSMRLPTELDGEPRGAVIARAAYLPTMSSAAAPL